MMPLSQVNAGTGLLAGAARAAAIALVGVFCMTALGCATVVRGEHQTIDFKTDPAGATVKAGDLTCTTPGSLNLLRKDTYPVTVSKQGYRTVTFEMKAQWDGASLPGAALPGGSLSVAGDRASGADLAFYQPPLLKLEPAGAYTEPQQLVLYRGNFYTEQGYKKELEQERRDVYDRINDH